MLPARLRYHCQDSGSGSDTPSGSAMPTTDAVRATPTANGVSAIVTVPALGGSFALRTRTTSANVVSAVPFEAFTFTTYSLFAAPFAGLVLALSLGAS